jgi:hypothetical protein
MAAVAGMVVDLERVNAMKMDLEHQASECMKRIERAAKLIHGLGGEKERYVAIVHRFHLLLPYGGLRVFVTSSTCAQYV